MAKNKKPKGKPKKSGKFPKKKLQRAIIDIISQNPNKPHNYKQIAATMGVSDPHTRSLIMKTMNEMAAKQTLKEEQRGKFKMGKNSAFIEGIVDMTQSGSAYIKTEQLDEDIYIPPKFVGHALHGDTVKVFLLARKKRRKPEGQITEIVKRAKTEFVGVIEVSKNFAFLVPDNRKMLVDLYIPLDKLNGAENGQKAIAKMTDWPKDASSPFGEVIDVLGDPLQNEVEMSSILFEYGFPQKFPEKVEQAAANIPVEISDDEVKKRRDMRDVETFTIDPHDAKDFDDAISFRELKNGNYEIGVHIADVTHYVQENDMVDKEAVERATSVYLVDRVVPMLPEILSNKVCSLRPNEEKLTFSCVFELDKNGHVQNHWIGRTVTESDNRFTYEEAQEVIESGEGKHSEALTVINSMAKQMRNRRLQAGAIAFDKVEVKFKLNDKNEPDSVLFKVQKDAHKLIEEFMLLANRTVAEDIGKITKQNPKPKTFVYRIHDTPDPEKLADFSAFIKKFGYKYSFAKEDEVSKNINQLLAEVQGKREETMVETLAIRTMAKAEYSTDNIGHYGLGFRYYTHFTSPIRRYPDMMVHRLLDRYAKGGNNASQDHYQNLCNHSSEKEREAANAERDSIKYFQVMYMKESVGETFNGVISGVTEWGLYVEIIENKCEGMIRLREIDGDYFYFDEKNHRIVGHNYGRVLQLGDEIQIKVKNADLYNRRLEFELVDEDDE